MRNLPRRYWEKRQGNMIKIIYQYKQYIELFLNLLQLLPNCYVMIFSFNI
jgi:hypothetical protein